jgi:hypothetical protein
MVELCLATGNNRVILLCHLTCVTRFVEFSPNSQNVISLQDKQLTELQCYWTSKIKFSGHVMDFNKNKRYPVIIAKAMHILLQFPTSCLCQQAFLCLTNIMSKERNCLLRDYCGCVCQKFGKKFNICAKRNKLKSHTESKPHIDCDENFILMFNPLMPRHLKTSRSEPFK